LWSKDCFSQVVGEVASLVDIDEASYAWDNLEYARLQVRQVKSCKVELSKRFQINGQIYNISIIEEMVSQGEENASVSGISMLPLIVFR